MCYLIVSKNKYDNFLKVYNENELIFFEDEIIDPPFDVKECIINNIPIDIIDLSVLVKGEAEEWANFYNKERWEEIFWIMGYNITNKEKIITLEDIVLSGNNKVILFYIQNVLFLIEKFEKGFYFGRFYDLCLIYEKKALKNEKNKIFIEVMRNYKENWLIV